jgi:cytochrome oxidase Cu insertion factor (SCO1/SenC/PrrC family)
VIYRAMSFCILAVALIVLAGVPSPAAEKGAKPHVGKLVDVNGSQFTMTGKDKTEHKHTLAAGAKVTDADGKECKLDDLKGKLIRVTTKEGDAKTATKVEGLKKKKKE